MDKILLHLFVKDVLVSDIQFKMSITLQTFVCLFNLPSGGQFLEENPVSIILL